MRSLILLYICVMSATLSYGQGLVYKPSHSHDIGLFIGTSYYIGDLNPRKHFALSQPALGIFYRYNPSYRIGLRAGFTYGSIQGDDSQSDNRDQLERNLSFKTDLYEIYGQAEFNFWEYQTGHNKFEFAPYIFLGLDVFQFDPEANYQNRWYGLQKLRTEGQGTDLNPGQKPYKLIQVAVPFGIGFKLSLAQQVGLGFEWGPRKTFTDYLDDVSGKYVDRSRLVSEKGYIASMLSDRSGKPYNTGKMRGNPVTKDWFFYCGFTLSFKLKFKPPGCPSVAP